MADLTGLEIDETNGTIILPNGTTAQRPSSALQGSLRYNIDTKNLEIFNGNGWQSLYGRPGEDPCTAFASTNELDNQGYSGLQLLYTTLGNRISPLPVLVDFESPGGPYILMSFRFTTGGFTNFNNTLAGNHSGTNDYTLGNSSRRLSRSNDIGLGNGFIRGDDNFHPNQRIARRPAGAYDQGSDSIQSATINYFNHGTGLTLTKKQETALRNWVKKISPETPHAGIVVDNDGDPLDSSRYNFEPFNAASFDDPGTSSHSIWIESEGNIALLTPAVERSDEHHIVQLWTESTYRVFPSSGVSPGGLPPSSNTGLSSISSKLLIPQRFQGYVYTGGGWIIGTPYSPNARNGQGNFLNDRVFFLIRD